MEDATIIALYFARDESALSETERSHGAFCRRVALNILHSSEDAEECVNDTYHAAWNAIPPERPQSLRAFLGRITRNLSLQRWRASHALKRGAGPDLLLSELEDCLPTQGDAETALEQGLLTECIADWLRALPAADRVLFVRRYWYGDAVKALARECGVNENRMAQRLRRLRGALKKALEKGGFTV